MAKSSFYNTNPDAQLIRDLDSIIADARAAAASAHVDAGAASASQIAAANSQAAAAASAAAADVSEAAALASQNAAAASALAALNSQNSASASATTASTKASEASTSATNAAASASAALASKNAAATSETNAAASAAAALASKNAASTSETNAAGSASAASTSASNSASSATASQTARTGAETARTGSEAARDLALAHRDSAYGAEQNALNYANTAYLWAEKIDGPVTGSEYSARAWSNDAKQYRNTTLTYRDAAAASASAAANSAAAAAVFDPSTYFVKSGGTITGFTRINMNSNGNTALLLNGLSKGVRIIPGTFGTAIEGVDQTGVGSYQPLTLKGTTLTFDGPATLTGNATFSAFNTGVVLAGGGKLMDQSTGGNAGLGRTVIVANNDSFKVISEDTTQPIFEANYAGTAPTFKDQVVWHAGNFTPSAKASLGTSVNFADVTANRGDGTGVIYLGNGTHYLYWDGANYQMPSGPLWVGGDIHGSGGYYSDLRLGAAAGTNRTIKLTTGGTMRWEFGAGGQPEGGSNTGSMFQIARFTDAGAYVDTPFYIDRSNGLVSMPKGIFAPSLGMDAVAPSIDFNDTAGSTNQKRMQIKVYGGATRFNVIDDAYTTILRTPLVLNHVNGKSTFMDMEASRVISRAHDVYDSTAGTNLKTSRWYGSGGYTRLEILNDAYSAVTAVPISIDHAAGTVWLEKVTSPLKIAAQGGNEGGEIQLAKPATGATISGDVTVDMANDNFRVFEGGGAYRGFYVDLTKTQGGAGSALWHSGNMPAALKSPTALANNATISSSQSGLAYLMDINTGAQVFNLPAVSSVYDGWSCVVFTNGNPTGYQTARVSAETGKTVLYSHVSDQHFYLAGRGEAFRFTWMPTFGTGVWFAELLKQPQPFRIARWYGGSGSWNSGTTSTTGIFFNNRSGDYAMFNTSNSATTGLPVTGNYRHLYRYQASASAGGGVTGAAAMYGSNDAGAPDSAVFSRYDVLTVGEDTKFMIADWCRYSAAGSVSNAYYYMSQSGIWFYPDNNYMTIDFLGR